MLVVLMCLLLLEARLLVTILVEIVGATEVLSLVHQLTMVIEDALRPATGNGLIGTGQNSVRWLLPQRLLAPHMLRCLHQVRVRHARGLF